MIKCYPAPKCDRTWTKEEWKKRVRISKMLGKLASIAYEERKDEIEKRHLNLILYGTTHPELITDFHHSLGLD